MMKSYGTPASEGDVQRAQFLNYLKAPKPLQMAMKSIDRTTPGGQTAFMDIQNSMASAEEDLGTRLGMPAPARQWTMATAGTDRAGYGDGFAGTPGQTPPGARSLVERTVSGLGADHPLTAMLNPQAEQERRARAAERQAAQPAVNARGVLGATFGEVNGRQMLVPQAGHYGEFQGSMAAEGLNGQMGVDRGAFEQRRSALVRQQEASRRQTKQDAAKAAQTGHERALELAGIKASGGYGKSGDTVSESGEKKGQGAYFKDRSFWLKDQRAANALQARLKQKFSNPGVDPDLDTIKVGNQEMTLSEAQAWAEEVLTDPGPQREDYSFAEKPAAPAAAPKGPGFLRRVGNALGMGGGPAPASAAPTAPTGAPPQNRQQARNAYISGLDPSLWNSLDHNEREQFLASQGL